MKTKKKTPIVVSTPLRKPLRSWSHRDRADHTTYLINHANGKKSGFDVTAPGFVDCAVSYGSYWSTIITVRL